MTTDDDDFRVENVQQSVDPGSEFGGPQTISPASATRDQVVAAVCNPQIFDVCAIIETMMSVHPRITIESDKRDGKPCIRGMRITVNDVLGWLAHGMTEEEILEEHPGLEKEDFAAVYAFAADVADTVYGGR
jgi:uncharacterized protein (DUF433 family)